MRCSCCLLSVLTLAFALSGSAAATVTTYDGFSYPAGSPLDLQNGGTGFANAWFATPEYVIGSGSLAPLNLATTGNCVSFVPVSLAGEQADREPAPGSFGTDGTTSWLGFVLRPDSDPTTGLVQLQVPPLSIGKLSPTDANLYAVRGATLKQFSGVPMVPGAAVFVVVKFEFNADPAASDVASIYFNPTPGLAAPDVAPIVLTDSNFSSTGEDIVLFTGNHAAFSFDELRIGTSYADVAPGSPSGWFELGHAKAGSNGTPLLTGTGSLAAASPDQLDLANAKASSTATLVVGLTQLDAPFKGGVLVPDPILLIALPTGPTGAISLSFVMPGGLPTGTTLFFQDWIQDAGADRGLSASNGLEAVTP